MTQVFAYYKLNTHVLIRVIRVIHVPKSISPIRFRVPTTRHLPNSYLQESHLFQRRLLIRIPVPAIQFEESGGVRHRQVRFENDYLKCAADAVECCDQFVVFTKGSRSGWEEAVHLLSERVDTRTKHFRQKTQFLILIDMRIYMRSLPDGLGNESQYLPVRRIRIQRRDARLVLKRVGLVRHHDPVPVSQPVDLRFYLLFPRSRIAFR